MDKKKSGSFGPMIGGCSLLVIFAVLCLTVFSLLGLSTVQADKRLSDISAEAVKDYYAADCRGEEILACLREGQCPDFVERDGDIYRYSCPISDVQALFIEVRVQDAQWEVLRWEAVSIRDAGEEQNLSVWDGNT